MKREIRKWWNGGSFVRNFEKYFVCLVPKEKERKEANNDIVRVHHEKRKDGNKEK